MPVRIISSTLNLSPKHAALWTIQDHRAALSAAGYDGTTYYPLDNVLAAQIASGKDAGSIIAAFQQPWREQTRAAALGKLVGTALRQPGNLGQIKAAAFDTAMNMAMPHMNRGLAVISRLQKRIGTDALRPIIVHPQGQMLGDALSDPTRRPKKRRDYHRQQERRRLGELQWQPTVEWAKNRGVLSDDPQRLVSDMIAVAQEDGLGRAAFDANHAQAVRQGMRFTDPVAMAGHFAELGQLGSFEIGVQPHLGGDIKDLRLIMGGQIGKTIHGDMLAAAAEKTPAGRDFTLRVEIPAYAMNEVGYSDYLRAHQVLVPMLGDFVTSHLASV